MTTVVNLVLGPARRGGGQCCRQRKFHQLVRALLVLASSACAASELTGTVPQAAGTYVLRDIDGQPVGSAGAGPFVSPFVLLADTLHIDPTGTVTEIVVTQRAGEPAARAVSTMRLSTGGGGSGRATIFEFAYPCPDFASCIAPPHHVALLDGKWLTVTSSIVFRTPLRFERLSGGGGARD